MASNRFQHLLWIDAQKLIKLGTVHSIGLQQPGGDAFQSDPMFPQVRLDLIHDADCVGDPDLPAQAIRQQQLVGFRRYGSWCQFVENHFLCEGAAVQHPYPIDHRGLLAQSHPALPVDAMKFDDGDAQTACGSDESVPGFMDGGPVPFGIPQNHICSVAERYAP